MKEPKLRAAMIIGTIALIWSVPSLNIFGIIASVMSWAAYGKSRRDPANAAGAMYIIATVISIGLALLLLFGSSLLTVLFAAVGEGTGEEITGFMSAAAGISVIGDILYIIAAVYSFLGSRALKSSGQGSEGFFE